MKSFTSRPRSPIRAVTMTSADVYRDIMPSVTLLPTPEPEKMPMRCPRPHVSRASIARMPVESGWSIRGRSTALGGWQLKLTRPGSTGCGRLSMATPWASMTRPNNSSPTGSQRAVRIKWTRLPCRTPVISLSGYSNVS
jgi:hypothetical protein